MVDKINFSYSNRLLYYSIWFGGTLLFGLILAFGVLPLLLKMIGIDVSGGESPFFEQYGTEGFIAFVLFLVVVGIILFVVMFFIANNVTDKKGVASFFEDYVEFAFDNKNLQINYADIYDLNMRIFSTGKSYGPPLYRLRLCTSAGNRTIACSFKESWECRKNYTTPKINEVYEKIQSILEVKK